MSGHIVLWGFFVIRDLACSVDYSDYFRCGTYFKRPHNRRLCCKHSSGFFCMHVWFLDGGFASPADTIIPGIVIHWVWDCLAFMTNSQGGLVMLFFEFSFFFYGLWLLRNYLPSRFQTLHDIVNKRRKKYV